jgi:hypothetical protein
MKNSFILRFLGIFTFAFGFSIPTLSATSSGAVPIAADQVRESLEGLPARVVLKSLSLSYAKEDIEFLKEQLKNLNVDLSRQDFISIKNDLIYLAGQKEAFALAADGSSVKHSGFILKFEKGSSLRANFERFAKLMSPAGSAMQQLLFSKAQAETNSSQVLASALGASVILGETNRSNFSKTLLGVMSGFLIYADFSEGDNRMITSPPEAISCFDEKALPRPASSKDLRPEDKSRKLSIQIAHGQLLTIDYTLAGKVQKATLTRPGQSAPENIMNEKSLPALQTIQSKIHNYYCMQPKSVRAEILARLKQEITKFNANYKAGGESTSIAK